MATRSESYPHLPPLPKLPAKEMAGPTPWSNWVIPGQVLAGAYPASMDDNETERIIRLLLELGVNTFVCLQAEVNINIPEHSWRNGQGLRPYIKDAQRILSKAHETGDPKITQRKIDFLHLAIIDGNVTSDSAMNKLAEDCCDRVLRGEKMYIHCWGGHGRTGTLVVIMLARLYNQSCANALKFTQAFHDSRIYPQGVRSPQTAVQRAQVKRIVAAQPNHMSAVAASGANRPPSISGVPRDAHPSYSSQNSLSKQASRIGGSAYASSGGLSRPGSVSNNLGITVQDEYRNSINAKASATIAGSGGRYGVRSDSNSRGADSSMKSAFDRLTTDLGRLGVSGNTRSNSLTPTYRPSLK